ncbi:MAG: DUF2948 family protein [Methylocystis sp.]
MVSPDHSALRPGLRLHALDAEDLGLVSAHLQDALLRVGDLAYLPKKRRFALIASRFDWTARDRGRLERCRAGLHFEAVRAVRYAGVARERLDGVLELLALVFEPGATAPEGRVRLIFAGGATILLDVDCIEAQLCDLGPRWPVSSCPTHHLDEGGGAGS